MSILFSRLKNLKKRDGSDSQALQEKKRTQRKNSFRRFVFSPVGSAIILIFIIIFGILTFYSLLFLKQYIDQKSKLSITVDKAQVNVSRNKKVPAKPSTPKTPDPSGKSSKSPRTEKSEPAASGPMIGEPADPKDFQIPAGPGVIEAGVPEQGNLLLKPKKRLIKEAPGIPQADTDKQQYALGARSGNAGGETNPSASGSGAAPGQALSGPKAQNQQAPRTTADAVPRQTDQTTGNEGSSMQLSDKGRSGGSPNSQIRTPQIQTSQGVTSQSLASQSGPAPSAPGRAPAPAVTISPVPETKGQAAPVTQKPQLQISDEKTSMEKQQRHRQKTKMKKTAQIASLTSDIRKKILQNDYSGAKALLDTLSRYKDGHSSYITKLKAFMFLKQNQTIEAKHLLEQVLDLEPDDLEAGINMAVVETRLGDVDKAKKRLEHLLDIYPSNPNIERLLDQL